MFEVIDYWRAGQRAITPPGPDEFDVTAPDGWTDRLRSALPPEDAATIFFSGWCPVRGERKYRAVLCRAGPKDFKIEEEDPALRAGPAYRLERHQGAILHENGINAAIAALMHV